MIREKLIVTGRVQGVGFRPFVYKIANRYGLNGYVLNSAFGVVIEVEGSKSSIEKFKNSLISELPPLAKIDKIKSQTLEPKKFSEFKIVHSQSGANKSATILPDSAICSDCKDDIKNNPKYRGYFSTNCTNCGPRYSIVYTVPYDRANTSMREFELCPSCKEEYENPLSRRYHAQPTACAICGPSLELKIKSEKLKVGDIYDSVASLIKSGKIGAIKGVGGFHIVCDATNSEVVKRLRVYKNRPTKPFALMCKDVKMAQEFAEISKMQMNVLTSKEAPIVLLKSKESSYISKEVHPGIDRVGVMVAYTPFYVLLFEHLDKPIVATSANLGGEPIITEAKEIEKKLPFIDFIVDYNRKIVNAIDDSVVQVVDDKLLIIRPARGYAPKEIKLPFKLENKILAVGANQKSTIALAFEDKIILSPYIGDLNSLESFEFFIRTLNSFKRFYGFEPDIVVCDKHPNYMSRKFANELKVKNKKLKIYEVQHHIAHLYSVMAEHNLKGDFLSFIFDGTGYGDDGSLWGGEVFVGDKRKYHFKPIKLIGGELAIKEPRRVALSLLFEEYSLEKLQSLNLEVLKKFKPIELKLLHQSWNKNLNSPKSSSVGRLFDAVASLSNLCHFQTYEGEAGLLCEANYKKEINDKLEYKITDGTIDIKIIDYIKNNPKKLELLPTLFINTLVQIIIDITLKEQKEPILSGGVFQNATLLNKLISEFKKQNINYHYNQNTPINDSGVALGQLWWLINKNLQKR